MPLYLSCTGSRHCQRSFVDLCCRLCLTLIGSHAIAGFVRFVLRLEKGCYMYQFGQYAWTHLILLFVFIPSSFFVSNIFDGIIWFLLPCSLVIANDIFAYLAGDPSLPRALAYAGHALCQPL